MELRRLRYFVRVAEDGSLARASGVLRIAQPALSRQMRLLEEDLGVQLFVRLPRGMQLTEQGEQLQALVAGPLGDLEQALDIVRGGTSSVPGSLIVGMPPGLAEIMADAIVEAVSARFTDMALRVVEGPTGSLIDWLNRGLVDVALLEEAPQDHRLEHHSIACLPLWLIGAPGGKSDISGPMPLAQAMRLPLILPSHHMGIRGAVNDAIERLGLPLQPRLQADVPRLIRSLAVAGKGYGVLPRAYCQKEMASGELGGCPLSAPDLAISVCLAVRRHGRVRPGKADDAVQVILAAAKAVLVGA